MPTSAATVSSAPSSSRVRVALAIALLVGGAAAAIGYVNDPVQFFRSYLVAWLFWLAISVGSVTILLLHNLTGGGWGLAIRRVLLAATGTLPYVALLFIPIVLNLIYIYEWADSEHVAHDSILQFKAPYLNERWFIIRGAAYFLIWLLLAFFLRSQARKPVPTDPDAARRTRVVSGLGLGLTGLTVTFASIDWVMSLEPHWYSAIYGVLMLVAWGLQTMAFAIVALVWWPRLNRISAKPDPQNLHDLGKLLLAFTMLWAYMAFSQFLIIWYGNLPEENVYYIRRFEFGWQWVAIALALLHYVLPFIVLLNRDIKRRGPALAAVALWLLAMRWVDMVWLVEPAFKRTGTFVPWIDLALTVAIGSVWLALFTWQLPVAEITRRVGNAARKGGSHG